MKKKVITICGKEVTLAYCYATEIAFHGYTGQDNTAQISESLPHKQVSPNNVSYTTRAPPTAYYEHNNEEPPIVDKDLMFNAEPAEIQAAFLAVTELYREWYKLPAGEPEDKAEDQKKTRRRGKN